MNYQKDKIWGLVCFASRFHIDGKMGLHSECSVKEVKEM